MKINVDIDKQYHSTNITIQTNEWTDELQRLIDFINEKKPNRLFGIDGDQTVLLDPKEIDYFFVENRKVYAVMEKRKLEIKMKLFEIEETFANQDFMRFSKSVIGNTNQINRFELSFNGNLCVYFHSGNKEYISRKYVTAIKERLEIGGKQHGI